MSEDLACISEYGEGQKNECPACGAMPGEPCSGPDPIDPDGPFGVEYFRKVHRARLYTENELDAAIDAARKA